MISALELGRVVDVHPEHNAVDVCLLGTNHRLAGVPVIGSANSGDTGTVDLPVMDLTTARAEPAKWDSDATDKRDMLAVIAYVDRQPICLGFHYPPLSQMHFLPDGPLGEGFHLRRGAGDTYEWTQANGDQQRVHPSGSYEAFGEQRAFLDLEAKDYDKLWKLKHNVDRRPGKRLVIKNGGHSFLELDFDADGNVNLRMDGNLTADVDGNADVHVKGDAALHVEGDVTLHVEGDTTANLDGDLQATVGGDATVNVSGDATLDVDGAATVTVGGALAATAGGAMTLEAPTIALTAPEILLTGLVTHVGDMTTTGTHIDKLESGDPGFHIP